MSILHSWYENIVHGKYVQLGQGWDEDTSVLDQPSLSLEYVPNNIAKTPIYLIVPATHFFCVD